MLAAALPSHQTQVSRRLSLRHVKVVPPQALPREAASHAPRSDTILAPLTTPQLAAVREAGTPARLTTEKLFNGKSSLEIMHHGEAYKLTITSKGKLILTK